MEEKTARSLLEQFFGHQFAPELVDAMLRYGKLRKVPAGEMVMDVGTPIVAMPIVLSGALKVMREDGEEGELLLYYLAPGTTCATSLTCCVQRKISQIRAIAEEDSILLMLPGEYLNDWIARYPDWKNFVFNSMQSRIDELLEAIDTIAFMKMDERLWKYLKEKAVLHDSDQIEITHREIAEDLHTGRVVISRLLKKLELQKRIQVGRNQIRIFG